MPTDVAMTWEFAIHLFLVRAVHVPVSPRVGLRLSTRRSSAGSRTCSAVDRAATRRPGTTESCSSAPCCPPRCGCSSRGMRDGRRWAWGALVARDRSRGSQPASAAAPVPAARLRVPSRCTWRSRDPDAYGRLPRDVALKRLGFALGAVAPRCAHRRHSILPVPSSTSRGRRAPAATTTTTRRASRFRSRKRSTRTCRSSPEFSTRTGAGTAFIFIVTTSACRARAHGRGVRRDRTRRSFRRFWWIAGVVALLWAFGGNTPFFQNRVCARSGHAVFPRAEHDVLRRLVRGVGVGALGVERILAGQVGTALCDRVGGGELCVHPPHLGRSRYADHAGRD